LEEYLKNIRNFVQDNYSDKVIEKSMLLLQQNDYNTQVAFEKFKLLDKIEYCPLQWSDQDRICFEEEFGKHGKRFHLYSNLVKFFIYLFIYSK
jgi:hypothetical protein